MDHREAVASRAVDRYLLDEMSEEEQQAFEQHYFECAECAAEVEAGTMLAANVAAVFAEEGRRDAAPRRVGLWGNWKWVAVAFAGLVLLIVAVEGLVRIQAHRTNLAAISAPQAYPVFFLHAVARGGDQVVEASGSARFIGLSFDVPPGPDVPAYDCRLLDASGQRRWSVKAPPPRAPGEPIHLLLPAAASPPGDYTLVLSGGGKEIHRYQFTLKNK